MLVIGGCTGKCRAQGRDETHTLEAYTLATDSWTTKAPRPSLRAYSAAGFVPAGTYSTSVSTHWSVVSRRFLFWWCEPIGLMPWTLTGLFRRRGWVARRHWRPLKRHLRCQRHDRSICVVH
jgi:hypothetical protein